METIFSAVNFGLCSFMQELSQKYPNTESILLVQDNLNTHTTGSFYEVFIAWWGFWVSKAVWISLHSNLQN